MRSVIFSGTLRIVVFVIVGTIFTVPIYSQKDGYKRTYSGELDLRDLQKKRDLVIGIEYPWEKCTGSYQYIEATDGSRIFDGSFKFRTSSGNQVVGEFVNNKQVGEWVYFYSKEETTRISFENGTPQGSFVVQNPRKTDLQCRGSIQNGKLHSSFIFEMKYPRITVSGSYNQEGKPIDNWTILINGKYYTSVYDKNGNKKKDWYRVSYDDSTGDKKYINADIDSNYSPEAVGRAALGFISMYLLRDSKL